MKKTKIEILKEAYEKITSERKDENWSPFEVAMEDGSVEISLLAMEIYKDQELGEH